MSSPEDITDAEPPAIDPYEVLNLDRAATPDQIKSAYRKAALKNHPGTKPPSPPLLSLTLTKPASNHPLPNRQGPPRKASRSPHNLPIHSPRLRRPLLSLPPRPLRRNRLHLRLRLRRRLRLGHLLPRALRGRRVLRRNRALRRRVPLLRRGAGRCPRCVRRCGGGYGCGL